jgi:hypothetical protein
MIGASAASASPGDVTCTGTIGTNVAHDLIVPNNGTLCLVKPLTQIGHDIIVQPGGRLRDSDGTVGHDVVATNPASFGLGGADMHPGGSVGHDVIVNGVTGNGPQPGLADNWVCNATIGHDLVIENSAATAGQWDLGDMDLECGGGGLMVGHDFDVINNQNPVDVSDNDVPGPPPPYSIGHDLNVFGNAVAPIVENNTVGHDANCQSNVTGDGDGTSTTAGHNNTCIIP